MQSVLSEVIAKIKRVQFFLRHGVTQRRRCDATQGVTNVGRGVQHSVTLNYRHVDKRHIIVAIIACQPQYGRSLWTYLCIHSAT